jgi:hypothetical protein
MHTERNNVKTQRQTAIYAVLFVCLVFVILGFELHLFCEGYFRDRVSQTIAHTGFEL